MTNNLTATPSITTDTNSYLASTNDSTDRTADILTMLAATGVCRLGVGNFYTTGITLDYGQMLIGSGKGTVIYLYDSVANGYVVKMASDSVVKDLQIRGSAVVTVSGTVGTRHGILFEGNANGDGDNKPARAVVENVYISRLNGGGITLTNTGNSTHNSMLVSDCIVYNCDAGVNVAYWSEYNKFTNIQTFSCYYGCINNGGNNVFVNCGFSNNTMGMLLDNEYGQSPNNSHGSAIGCTFNHSDSNSGIGIKMIGCTHGFVFDGCQIFYSQIHLVDSVGVVISNCNFGSNNCNINIEGGGCHIFGGNMHQTAPNISVTDNAKVKFINCYTRDGVAVTVS